MLDAAEKACAPIEGLERATFQADEVRALALVHLLEILGEAAKGVSEEKRARHPDIPWNNMAATRDRLIHGYFSVDLDIVWQIVSEDIPQILPAIREAARQP